MNDTISRQAAIELLIQCGKPIDNGDGTMTITPLTDATIRKVLEGLPSAQPEIIRCEDCMHNGSFDTDCPIGWNGKEYCNFAEREDDGE